jgi:hypothetical protein
MQISARSCLTAGISLTAATAVALAPIAIPAHDREVTVPNVTITDIQLTVTPGEVIAFFNNLLTQVDDFNAAVAEIAAVPGQTLVDGINSAITLNNQIFDSLIEATDNQALRFLFETLDVGNERSLRQLASFVGDGNDVLVLTGQQVADLLSGVVLGSLSNVLSATVAVLDNPLAFSNYTNLLASGIASVALAADGGGQVAQAVANAGFDLTYSTVDLVRVETLNALESVRRVIGAGSMVTGSPLIETVTNAVTAIAFAPVQLGVRIPASVIGEGLLSAQAGFNSVFNGVFGYTDAEGVPVPGVIGTAAGAVIDALAQIGDGPLSPERYLAATAILVAGSFDSFDLTVNTIGEVAQVPFDFGINLFSPDSERGTITAALSIANFQIANAISHLLDAFGLPENIVDLPLTVAEQVDNSLYAGATALVGAFDAANNVIAGGTAFVIDVSEQVESAILGMLPTPETDAASDARQAASEPSGDIVPVADDTTEDAPVDDAPVEEPATEEEATPAEDDTSVDDTSADEAPADQTPADDDESPSDDTEAERSYSSPRSEARRAERDAEKADSAGDSSTDSDAAA